MLPDNRHAGIVVSDNGIGIPPDEASRLFDKYYRGSNGVQMNITGQGLGLAIARNIMRKQGGDISIRSAGKPTEFLLDFRVANTVRGG